MSNHITLKDFLKKYTAISNKFIDEYYSFYEQCETNNFSIKIQDVMKYLNIKNQDKFEERLRNNFILRKDYEIIRYLHKLEKGKKAGFRKSRAQNCSETCFYIFSNFIFNKENLFPDIRLKFLSF